MPCSKAFSLEVTDDFPSPLAWWTMDVGIPTAEADSVAGLLLTPIAGGGFMTTQTGKVNNGYQQVSSIGQSVGSSCSDISLSPSGGPATITVAGWINVISINNPFLTQFTGLLYNFGQGADTFSFNLLFENDSVLRLTVISNLGNAGPIQIASALGWQFVVVTFDCNTGVMGLSVNNSAPTTLATGFISAGGAAVSGQFFVVTDANDAWTVRYDELAIFDEVLDATQIAHLWNAGNGRTFPP